MEAAEIDTNLVDLSGASLEQLQRHFAELRGPVEDLLRQVERPRYNIGSSNPPGRAD